jgi:hypothetical protein
MNSANRILTIIVMTTAATAGLSAALASAKDDAEPVAMAAAPATTVYLSGHVGGGTAKKLDEMHAKMAKDGWHFADMEVHTENSDTEGLWITYTKP